MRSKTVKIIAVILVCACVVGSYRYMTSGSDGASSEDVGVLLTHTIKREDFQALVSESGDIESSGSLEIKCEVKSEGRAAVTLLEIVEEGTVVKAGDFLVKFDDSALQQALTQQEILVAGDERLVITSESELNKAEQTLNEYRDGLFLVDKEQYESELLQAESRYKTAQDLLEHSKRMFKKGYVSLLQLEAQEVAVKMAEKNQQVVKTKLMVHTKFTLQKKVSEYESEIRKQKASLKAAKSTLKLSMQRLDEIKKQIANCNVVAPAGGQVVYANDFEKRANVVIEEGAQIREGQVVILLPNPNQMQVKVRINDSKIKQVKVGDPVKIELDVNPDLAVTGVVSKINPFPYPRQWYGGPIEYGTEIEIVDAPIGTTPGQRAKVQISVEELKDVIQVPIQSVVETGGQHYCLVRDSTQQWATRLIEIASNNGSFVVLKSGLNEGEIVALNPDLVWDDVFSGKEDETPRQDVAIGNTANS